MSSLSPRSKIRNNIHERKKEEIRKNISERKQLVEASERRPSTTEDAVPSELPRSPLPAALFATCRASGVAKLAGRSLTVFPPELTDPDKYLMANEKAWEITLPVKIDLGDNSIAELPKGMGSNLAFNELKYLELRNNQVATLDEGFFDLAHLVSLGLNGNPVAELSESLGKLATLTELDLCRSALAKLPESLGDLGSLVKLKLSHSPDLAALPDSTGKLARLQLLTADHCALTALPASLGAASPGLRTSLKFLDLSFNRLTSPGVAPSVLGDLAVLEHLNMASNRLSEPPPVPASPKLLRFFVNNNRIEKMDGPALLKAPALQEILLNDNKLTELPEELGALRGLRTLDVSQNGMRALPNCLGYLPELQRLIYRGSPCEVRIGKKDLSELLMNLRNRGPPHPLLEGAVDESNKAGKLYDQATQLLKDGQQEEAEAALKEAARLMEKDALETQETPSQASERARQAKLAVAAAVASRTLSLAGQGLNEWPNWCAEAAPAVQEMDLTGNHLSCLDAQVVGGCGKLRVLLAPGNRLGAPAKPPPQDANRASRELRGPALPRELRGCPLTRLVLDRNKLDAADFVPLLDGSSLDQGTDPGPPKLLAFTPLALNLVELNLGHNAMRELPPALFDLRQLVDLALAFNHLGAQAAEHAPWPRLNALRRLDLSNNKLEHLGSLPWLPKLETLNVAHNELTRLPEELGACPELKHVLIEGNRTRQPTAEVVAAGGAAVKEWLEKRLPPGYEKPPHQHEAAAAEEPAPDKEALELAQKGGRSKGEVAAELAKAEAELEEVRSKLENPGALPGAAKAAAKKEQAVKKARVNELKKELEAAQ
mmetsp:Transcript_62328/g.140970  ORF Transcript_62328/g.140970 Transcript_62328/m.140970 type:complete len:831 (-) Transcript_62328:111-2603(-)|eukprot:CAMPEP_0172589736 /NCGR_PEP_ID=MMETSP1068-20121228/8342_1 /TAXON_ID=35684 /ORGANISM="Pseudopedinella elastica, Strain CCMP716" /LENGTH=830 /DNA_ID=CAMNT_0013385381 /DNA_START=99 /DNA_END=2591 /DNA_ORIENTATION=-